MNREPETYDELIIQKKCIELTKYYSLTMEQLEEIYDFLKNNKNGNIQGKMTYILLNVGTSAKKTISAPCISQNIDGVNVNRKEFRIIPHYYEFPLTSGQFGSKLSLSVSPDVLMLLISSDKQRLFQMGVYLHGEDCCQQA